MSGVIGSILEIGSGGVKAAGETSDDPVRRYGATWARAALTRELYFLEVLAYQVSGAQVRKVSFGIGSRDGQTDRRPVDAACDSAVYSLKSRGSLPRRRPYSTGINSRPVAIRRGG